MTHTVMHYNGTLTGRHDGEPVCGYDGPDFEGEIEHRKFNRPDLTTCVDCLALLEGART